MSSSPGCRPAAEAALSTETVASVHSATSSGSESLATDSRPSAMRTTNSSTSAMTKCMPAPDVSTSSFLG